MEQDVVRVPLRARSGEVHAYALLSPEDAGLSRSAWFLLGNGYVARMVGQETTEGLHRVVMGLCRGDERQVDHRDGDPLNCTRGNLRIVTAAQNRQNVRAARGGSSRFRGVSFDRRRGTWRAQASQNGRMVRIGDFATELEARDAAVAWRAEHMPFSEERS